MMNHWWCCWADGSLSESSENKKMSKLRVISSARHKTSGNNAATKTSGDNAVLNFFGLQLLKNNWRRFEQQNVLHHDWILTTYRRLGHSTSRLMYVNRVVEGWLCHSTRGIQIIIMGKNRKVEIVLWKLLRTALRSDLTVIAQTEPLLSFLQLDVNFECLLESRKFFLNSNGSYQCSSSDMTTES